METFPALELLEAMHSFPCVFTFKVIGKAENDFPSRILTAIQSELDHPEVPKHSIRETKQGRHVSLTVEPMVQSSYHVLAIYRKIQTVEGLVMLL
ncbi:DUF493 domain-containing protein [Planctopirus hydrillae]|uniref:DUF493 domain-containing protein n=1 Tax=Planctopirus hydrillae TaxID=1841610 RepID=A0A1C3E8S2_9PLAN|nr:DUF493 domain-containing protein [Planctopirus hydrillae]ODA29611.1 hypothetical protein A6X21_08030 [Planctopirus hydrillae]